MTRPCETVTKAVLVLEFIICCSDGNTLTLTAVNGNTTCPGGDLVFNCTITATTDNFNFNWRREGAFLSSGASYLYNDNYASLSFDGFTINAYNIPPDYTLTSTATLREAEFSHVNYVLECLTLTPTIQPPRMTATIVLQGAQNPPSNLTITSPATLTWLSPASDLNCSFNYTINITNSSSVTEQMYSNSISLILTDLTRGENYSFAVAVTDSTGQHGPWSEELRVTWDVPQAVVDYTTSFVNGNCCASWKAPPNDKPPVLYYNVVHSITESGYVENLVSNITTTCVPISGLNHTVYLITVNAVNVVGSGVNTSGTCTPPTTTIVQSLETVSYPNQSTAYNSLPTKASTQVQLITPQNTPTSTVRQVCEAPVVDVSVLVASTLVSGVLSAIAAAIVTSIIMWYLMKKRYKHPQSTSGRGMQDDKSGTHELTSVVYDAPVLKDHQNQAISTQDNVAYAGTIPLKQNVAYEQVHVH